MSILCLRRWPKRITSGQCGHCYCLRMLEDFPKHTRDFWWHERWALSMNCLLQYLHVHYFFLLSISISAPGFVWFYNKEICAQILHINKEALELAFVKLRLALLFFNHDDFFALESFFPKYYNNKARIDNLDKTIFKKNIIDQLFLRKMWTHSFDLLVFSSIYLFFSCWFFHGNF